MDRKRDRFAAADRLAALPPYLFDTLDRMKAEAAAAGRDLIDLGIGDTDRPTPGRIIERLNVAAVDVENHHYPPYSGIPEFREAIADWCAKRYGRRPDPETEVLVTIGSKEGIAHIFLAFVNPGDVTLCPDPAYPVYRAGTLFAGGTPVELPLDPGRGFRPDLASIPDDVAERTRLMFVNYPNNPTAATLEPGEFQAIVDWCRERGIILCSDTAYSELTFDGYRSPGLLEAEGGMEIGVEFHSLSKSFNMTGWRLGFVVGNREIVAGLRRIKTNVDSGCFAAVQWAGVEALSNCRAELEENVRVFGARRDLFVDRLASIGWTVEKPRGTFYVWAPIPEGNDSMAFSKRLLERCGIVATPGVGFGRGGEGYIRFALTVGEERLEEAVDRMRGMGEG
jgi:LL-diaminopimelate aminotransferase